MQTIRDLLSRDLSQPVEEVIKLDQQDEQTVHTEITEYMTTDRIKRQYQEILQPIADAPGDPTEGVGVWISGFFGFGKSSFAKNLGYVISNRQVLDHPAARLFVQQLQEQSPGDPLVRRVAAVHALPFSAAAWVRRRGRGGVAALGHRGRGPTYPGGQYQGVRLA